MKFQKNGRKEEKRKKSNYWHGCVLRVVSPWPKFYHGAIVQERDWMRLTRTVNCTSTGDGLHFMFVTNTSLGPTRCGLRISDLLALCSQLVWTRPKTWEKASEDWGDNFRKVVGQCPIMSQ